MKKFSKLNDIAFHLVNKVNKKKLKINTLILKNWEYIFGQNNKFVQLKKTIINNKTESVIFELRVSPEKSFEMHSKTNEIVIKIEEVTGVKVNKNSLIAISSHQSNSVTLGIFLFLKISKSPSGIRKIKSGFALDNFFKDLISKWS